MLNITLSIAVQQLRGRIRLRILRLLKSMHVYGLLSLLEEFKSNPRTILESPDGLTLFSTPEETWLTSIPFVEAIVFSQAARMSDATVFGVR